MSSILSISSALSAAINGVINNASITTFTLDIQFTNTDDSSYNYSPLWIEELNITSYYSQNFADKLVLKLTMAPADYMLLFKNSKNLQVAIRVVYYNAQTAQRVFTPPPVSRVYRAMLMNPQDLSMKYSTGSMIPTSSSPLTEQHISAQIPTELHLIEADEYIIRQRQFHGIYSKSTISNVISHIAQSFSIQQIYLVPPDNKMQYDHIVIPPAHGIDDIFDYLQYSYGIYMKGIDWYYTNMILYVYPAYENKPSIKYKANIYNSPEGSFSGLHSYHSNNTSSDQLSIVSTTKVNTKDISRTSAENEGSGYTFMRSSSIMDKFSTTNSQGTFVNDDNSLTIGTVTDRTMGSSANNSRYTKTTDNIFNESSKLAKYDAVRIQCGWLNAVPFVLFPGHSISYHYDKNGSFITQQGILEHVEYNFKRQQKLAKGSIYGGHAILTFRAESDVTNAAQKNTL